MSASWREALRRLPVESVPNCLLCQNVQGVPDARWRKYLRLVSPFDVLRCPKCSLRWLSARPNSEGYRLLYSDDMYFGGSGASPQNYAAIVADRVAYMRARVRRLKLLFPASRHLSMLDYGAATGDFVRVALDAGAACVGIELSPDARHEALATNHVTLLAADDADQVGISRFDVVHMNHVLEHMPDPLIHLRWCRRILVPDGVLVLEVPQQFDNDLDRCRRWIGIGGERPDFDAYSLHHTYFFSLATMHELLRQAGFATIRSSTFNADKTPLWPFKTKNWILNGLLGAADRIHHGGNIIEVFARPT